MPFPSKPGSMRPPVRKGSYARSNTYLPKPTAVGPATSASNPSLRSVRNAAGETTMAEVERVLGPPGRVRIPDVAFYNYETCEGVKREAIPLMAPDLSVEVLSDRNTLKEIELKRQDLFGTGTRLVWEIDPETRTAEAFTGPDDATTVAIDGVLDGGDVLPGFKLPLAELFAKVDKAMAKLNGG